MTPSASPVSLPRLVASLDTIVTLCDDLCSVLEREREALTEGKDDALALALGEKRDRLRRIATAESEHRKVSAEISNELGLGRVDSSLADLACRMEGTARDQLVQAKDNLFKVMKEIGALNQGNARLIRRAQHYNRHLFGILTGPGADTYGPDGARRTGAPPVIQKRA
ncbi:MAG: flagellar protein FlgN [Elusimicrobia bacterium]|jgi:flagellar biosynthesis/type III secretory pathway chaperone|nr:flagellar protein FlgN [Elusimicrobiota bacterium]